MQFVQTHTIKAFGDEIRRQAFNGRTSPAEVGWQPDPVDKIRQVTISSFNEMVDCEGKTAKVAPSELIAA